MNRISTADEARRYEIRLKGRLDSRWSAWFDGLTLTQASDGITVIHGQVADQAALHGLLQTLRDLGLPLISVTQVEADHRNDLGLDPRQARTSLHERKAT